MKIFYTERDIETLYAQGVRQLSVDDNVVFTDLAREKVKSLGMALVRADATPAPATDLTATIKAAVIARLGTHQFDDLLDTIIPLVLKRLRP